MYPRCSTLNGCLSAAAVGYSPSADKGSLTVLAKQRTLFINSVRTFFIWVMCATPRSPIKNPRI